MNLDRMYDLRGKIAVVTGGTSGVGLATVRLLLQAGAKVALCSRKQANVLATCEHLQQEFPSAEMLGVACDVLSDSEVQDFAHTVQTQLGNVSILINNAGQALVSNFLSTTDEQWEHELRLKLFSVIYPSRAFLPQLSNQADAAIVCVNSLLAKQPEPHLVATSSARAALANLVRSMAVEFAPKNIRVNGIFIGTIDSGQWQRRYEQRGEDERDLEYREWLRRLAESKNIPLGRFG